MMVNFKSIHIKNFKAIKEATLEYKAGLFEVIGINEDGPFTSNGASKSTALEAIVQCLFNRTVILTPIEDTARKALGSGTEFPYILTANFEVDAKHYKVVNDRERMKITIYEDGKDLGIKSIKAALKHIQEIIGMDVNTFITLTFITQTTINNLLENFSSSALMKIILDFDKINYMDQSMKAELKDIASRCNGLAFNIKGLQDSLDILGKYSYIDTSAMCRDKAKMLLEASKLKDDILVAKNNIAEYEKLEVDIVTLTDRIEALKDSTICQCCGSELGDNAEAIQAATRSLETITDIISEYDKQELYCALTGLSEALTKVSKELQEVSRSIIAAETKNQMYEEAVTQSDTIRETLSSKELELKKLNEEQDIIATAISIIKKGDMHKDLLNSFVIVLNKYIAQFKGFVNLPYIGLVASPKKGSIAFQVFDSRFCNTVHIHTLSGGEKTRLRLILLLSMLASIQDMTKASTNLLIFDEALDTLDISAAPDLANLFEYLIHHDSKFIALISHGQQLKDIDFSGTLQVTKNNGIATLEVIHNE